jgi:GxxExxY protein
MIKEEYKYSALTSKIIGCAIEVHQFLGNGFQEVIYQRALEEEFILQGMEFAREQEISIFYKTRLVGTRRVDFLVSQVICVELKALITLEAVHLAQAINYLEAYNLEVGLLINFGARKLEFRRVINSKYKPKAN